MIQEEKQLLIKDLCARLPYRIKVWNSEFLDSIEEYHPNEILTLSNLDYYIKESIEVKPYLRPLSSMTDEERRYLLEELGFDEDLENMELNDFGSYVYHSVNVLLLFDWLLKHHFDFRGLIPMNLAIEAPKDMYKI